MGEGWGRGGWGREVGDEGGMDGRFFMPPRLPMQFSASSFFSLDTGL